MKTDIGEMSPPFFELTLTEEKERWSHGRGGNTTQWSGVCSSWVCGICPIQGIKPAAAARSSRRKPMGPDVYENQHKKQLRSFISVKIASKNRPTETEMQL